jgi:hypothetical protein
VTAPERFQPLHDVAAERLSTLAGEFDVERRDGYDLDRAFRRGDLATASARLIPGSERAAPLQVSFTSFPGLFVRAGRWHAEAIPACGCDACAETAETALERFSFLVDNVVAGRFSEELSLPPVVGRAWMATGIGGKDRLARPWSRTRISRKEARALLRSSQPRYDWEPWPRK